VRWIRPTTRLKKRGKMEKKLQRKRKRMDDDPI
jgi:hypothetical protein